MKNRTAATGRRRPTSDKWRLELGDYLRLGEILRKGGVDAFADALRLLGAETGLVSALWLNDAGWRMAAAHPSDLSFPDDLTGRIGRWVAGLRDPVWWDAGTPPLAGLALAPGASHVAWPLRHGGDLLGLWVASGSHLDALQPAAQLLAFAARCALLTGPSARPRASKKEFMDAVVDALPIGLYVVDRHYRIVAWNQMRETGTQGIAREDAIGQRVFDVLHRQPREKLQAELDDIFRTGRLYSYEVETGPPNERRHFYITKVPMRLGERDEVTHVITIGEDITEQRRAQEQIAHAEKLAALGQMVAGVMHEINNPLATIAACTAALKDHASAEEADLLAVIEAEVDRCTQIARDLLSFSRPAPSEKAEVDVQEIVDEALRLLQHHGRFRKIRVQREYVYDLLRVWANADALVQVFVALALNALDAMGEEGELRVRSEMASEGEVAVSFIDTGCGIAPSDLPRIFEPFYTTKPAGKGTGLGLSICHGIISEHGGRIEVNSTLGVGSNFRVVLPVAKPTDGV
ncbi:MAG: PAS domain-containing protein [Gemmatimonadetes bacterium]|nr:PAS domain-containing protein [Gemmatimonadota bacterium]